MPVEETVYNDPHYNPHRLIAKSRGSATSSASIEHIARSILVLRGQRVLLDVELADLYGVATKALLQAVRRNRERFPEDFMIQLNDAEWASLRSQTQAVS
jgi:ORF6N domain